MKKILVYSYFFYPEENANTNYIKPILQELQKHYQVDVVTLRHNSLVPKHEKYDGFYIYRYNYGRILSIIDYIVYVYELDRDMIAGRFRRAKGIIWDVYHWMVSQEKICRLLEWRIVRVAMVLRRLLARQEYEALFTLSAPIETQYTALALAKEGFFKKHGVQWFPVISDPHATFIGLADKRDELMKKELEIYCLADKIFTTPELYADNQRCELGQYADKTIPLEYAMIRKISNNVKIDYLPKNKINCIYVGSLFNIAVRNPEYFYRIANACDDRFCFHMVCYQADSYNLELKEKYVDNNPQIIWYDRKSVVECHSLMCEADILINLGNQCVNQMPSKVFEYISTGKPVVNIHTLDNDTSKRYLEKYPMALNIHEDENLISQHIEQFQNFCVQNYGNTCSFEMIKELFAANSSEEAAKKLVKACGV